jgi:hypothetical protein
MDGLDDVLGGEAEFLEQDRAGCAGAESFHAYEFAMGPGPTVQSEIASRFNDHAGLHRGR